MYLLLLLYDEKFPNFFQPISSNLAAESIIFFSNFKTIFFKSIRSFIHSIINKESK